jgi:hypothetical protein
MKKSSRHPASFFLLTGTILVVCVVVGINGHLMPAKSYQKTRINGIIIIVLIISIGGQYIMI